MDLLPEEKSYLEEHGRCTRCGHLNALHDSEDDRFCLVAECESCSTTVSPDVVAYYMSALAQRKDS